MKKCEGWFLYFFGKYLPTKFNKSETKAPSPIQEGENEAPLLQRSQLKRFNRFDSERGSDADERKFFESANKVMQSEQDDDEDNFENGSNV